jgi:hypothetical protein
LQEFREREAPSEVRAIIVANVLTAIAATAAIAAIAANSRRCRWLGCWLVAAVGLLLLLLARISVHCRHERHCAHKGHTQQQRKDAHCSRSGNAQATSTSLIMSLVSAFGPLCLQTSSLNELYLIFNVHSFPPREPLLSVLSSSQT